MQLTKEVLTVGTIYRVVSDEEQVPYIVLDTLWEDREDLFLVVGSLESGKVGIMIFDYALKEDEIKVFDENNATPFYEGLKPGEGLKLSIAVAKAGVLFPVSKNDKGDEVLHPSHYTSNGLECWDFIARYELDYFLGCAVKYIWRHKEKNGKQDLEKAINYLNKRLTLHGNWNERRENFTYQPINVDELQGMDTTQLAFLHIVSKTMTLLPHQYESNISSLISILEVYINEQY